MEVIVILMFVLILVVAFPRSKISELDARIDGLLSQGFVNIGKHELLAKTFRVLPGPDESILLEVCEDNLGYYIIHYTKQGKYIDARYQRF